MEAALCTKGVKLEVHPEPDEFFLFLLCEIKCATYLLPWLVHWPSSWPDRTDATVQELSIHLKLDKRKHCNCFFRKESMWIRWLCDSVTEQANLSNKPKVVFSNGNGLLIWRLLLLQHIMFDGSCNALLEVGNLTLRLMRSGQPLDSKMTTLPIFVN